MTTKNILPITILLLLCLVISCHKNPIEPNGDTKDNFNDMVRVLSYDVNQLSTHLYGPSFALWNIFPDPTRNSYVPDSEIVISLDQQFIVELTNCSLQDNWMYAIEDSAMKLIKSDSTMMDSKIKLSYRFCASSTCKGCVVFYKSVMNNLSYLIVEYTCNPAQSLELTLSHQDWIIDTTNPASILKIYLLGQTNATKLKVENYGDGMISAVAIYPKNNGNFSDTVAIAFSYDPTHRHIPTCDTRIALYGSIGFPKIVNILNPNNH